MTRFAATEFIALDVENAGRGVLFEGVL